MHSRCALQCFYHTRSCQQLLSLAGWPAASRAMLRSQSNAAHVAGHAYSADVRRSWLCSAMPPRMPLAPAAPRQQQRMLHAWAVRWQSSSQQPPDSETETLHMSDEDEAGDGSQDRGKARCAAAKQHGAATCVSNMCQPRAFLQPASRNPSALVLHLAQGEAGQGRAAGDKLGRQHAVTAAALGARAARQAGGARARRGRHRRRRAAAAGAGESFARHVTTALLQMMQLHLEQVSTAADGASVRSIHATRDCAFTLQGMQDNREYAELFVQSKWRQSRWAPSRICMVRALHL